MTRRATRRSQRGAVAPSPVVILSVVAVAMAALAWFATRGGAPEEREITPAADSPSSSAPASPSAEPSRPAKPEPPAVVRGKVYVEVYNNSGVTGLAGQVATRVKAAGWQVVGTDNWYGTIPDTTVYFPPRLKAAAKQLALDLGVKRTAPAVDPMRGDRLTLILTGPLR
ncbi:LytR C-terminal domain-containing protein [Nocardioides sp. SYSU D00038]|uniref:LytR C-terminal domain-containing protein n=1 Tax=Nocardioides sp. SYSU D00038 TaxID=2812554 RepID=UPI0027DE2502|nr:LytR C-terminal domain-containing protein [Nocardioides sp. SYSU D00038]